MARIVNRDEINAAQIRRLTKMLRDYKERIEKIEAELESKKPKPRGGSAYDLSAIGRNRKH